MRKPCGICGEIIEAVGKKKFCGKMTQVGTCAWKAKGIRRTRYKNSHSEKEKVWSKNYYQNNIESIRIKRKNVRLKLRFRVLNRDNFTCQYCGRKAPQVELHIDHKYPKILGGKNIEDNYTTACRDCNDGKSDIILNELL